MNSNDTIHTHTRYEAMQLDMNLTQLIDELGACERIKKTPVPKAYVLHTRRFIVLYLLTLPFALSKLDWYAAPAVFCVAYAFLGIEAIGIAIEDPFQEGPNDLPLGDICDGIRKNLLHLLVVDLQNKKKSRTSELKNAFKPPKKSDESESKTA